MKFFVLKQLLTKCAPQTFLYIEVYFFNYRNSVFTNNHGTSVTGEVFISYDR